MTIRFRWAMWLGVASIMVLALISCMPTDTPATPFPFTIEGGPFEPTLDLSDCSTTICCADCPSIPVDRIIDGDTFDSANARIRLFGVDTPELGEKCDSAATQRLRELARDSVMAERGPRAGDDYGRILFYVYTKDGESIDEIMVQEGLAHAWTRDGQHRDVLVAAEEGARRDGWGCLW